MSVSYTHLDVYKRQVQESIGTIYLLTANLPQAKTHFKKALKIYEKVGADNPKMIESKYQEIQELYPQMGIALAKGILSSKLKAVLYTEIYQLLYSKIKTIENTSNIINLTLDIHSCCLLPILFK